MLASNAAGCVAVDVRLRGSEVRLRAKEAICCVAFLCGWPTNVADCEGGVGRPATDHTVQTTPSQGDGQRQQTPPLFRSRATPSLISASGPSSSTLALSSRVIDSTAILPYRSAFTTTSSCAFFNRSALSHDALTHSKPLHTAVEASPAALSFHRLNALAASHASSAVTTFPLLLLPLPSAMQKLPPHRGSRPPLNRRQQWRLRISTFLDSLPFTILAVFLTVIILFMDDFRQWLFPKSADPAFFALTLAILCLFVCEIVLSSLVKEDYFLRFFFFLDVLAAFSLIPDIPLIWDPIIGVSAQQITSNNVGDIAAAAHASSAASPANRLIKFVRLIRLVRIAKLFELCAKTKKQQQALSAVAPSTAGGASVGLRKGHSQVGQHLSEQTTRKVVLLVLLMLFGIPLLQPQDSQQGEEYSLRELSLLSTSPSLTPAVWQDELNFTLGYYDSLLYLNVSAGNAFDFTYFDPALLDYRVSEILSVQLRRRAGVLQRARQSSRLKGEYNMHHHAGGAGAAGRGRGAVQPQQPPYGHRAHRAHDGHHRRPAAEPAGEGVPRLHSGAVHHHRRQQGRSEGRPGASAASADLRPLPPRARR